MEAAFRGPGGVPPAISKALPFMEDMTAISGMRYTRARATGQAPSPLFPENVSYAYARYFLHILHIWLIRSEPPEKAWKKEAASRLGRFPILHRASIASMTGENRE